MNMMLDLKNMTDEEFSILVTPSAPQAAMYVKIEETGSVLLSSKVAEKNGKDARPDSIQQGLYCDPDLRSRKWGQRDISKERQKNSSQCRKNSQREQNSISSNF